MCRDNATPTRPDPESLQFLLGKTLVGWEEIRQALEFVEEHRKHEIHSNVRIEVYEYSESSNLKVTFRTVSELDEYLQSCFRGMLLKGVGDSLKLDDLQKASDEVYARFNEMNNVHGLVILN